MQMVLSQKQTVFPVQFWGTPPKNSSDAFISTTFTPKVTERLSACPLSKLFARREVFHNLVNRATTRDGREILLLTNGVPIIGPDGELTGYRGIDVDVTRQKDTELRLRESEARNKALPERPA